MIRVVLPPNLRTLAHVGDEVKLETLGEDEVPSNGTGSVPVRIEGGPR